MIKTDEAGLKINALLTKENELLTVILAEQRVLRETVKTREWNTLEATIYKIQLLSDQFNQLEATRSSVVQELVHDEDLDIYQIAHLFSSDLRQSLLENFRLMRQKLSVSKIENESISEYLRITKDFIQNVFDNAVPQSRNTVYSNKGTIVKPMPESVIVDQLL